MARLTCIAVLLLAMCASTAFAAPPWSAPESVSSASLFVDSPDVVFTADGRAIASWRWTGARPSATSATAAAPDGWRLAVREPGALDFNPERSAPNFVTPLIPYSLDRLIALDTKQPSRTRITLRARFGRSDGTFSGPRTISTYRPDAGTPSLAAPNGSIAAWIAGEGSRRVVRAALKRPGGRFSRPFTLRSRGRANDVVAGAALGVLFVAWERAGVIEARVRLAGRRWSALQRLGRAQPRATAFQVIGAGRRAYVAWLAEGVKSRALQIAVLPAAGARFRKAQTIDVVGQKTSNDGRALDLVPVPDRDALLAWTDWAGGRPRVRAAVTSGGARFGAPFDVSPAGQSSVLGDAASVPLGTPVPGGTVMLVWSRLDAVSELGDHVQAAIRPPGGSFGPPEDVTDLDSARLPAVAFDFNSHRWTTVWSQRIGPDGPGVPLPQITTFARSSTRPG